jgi:DNA-directed RNA polymerase specialized sigma24 family protein
MLMPESEPPKHLLRAEVDAALVRLIQDAAQMARVQKIARALSSGLPAVQAEDLLNHAMMLALAERRKWPRDVTTIVFLKNVMRSIASSARKKPNHVLAEDLGAQFDDESEVESSPLAEGVSPEADPARVVAAESVLASVQKAVKGDEELELYVEAMADGLTGMAIAEELGWDGKKYDAARKRLGRRLSTLKSERS